MHLRLLLAALFSLLLTHRSASIALGELKIGFGSCISEPSEVNWKHLSDQKFDLFLFLGDNVYFPDPAPVDLGILSQSYHRLFQVEPLLQFLRITPYEAIWDDHDYGSNNSGKNSPTKKIARELFVKYWVPSPLPRYGIYRRLTLRGVDILLTDNRTFRSDPHGSHPTYFGSVQKAWLTHQVETSKQPIIIASGNQLLTKGSKSESLTDYPEEHTWFVDLLKTSNVPIIVISGDPHFGEISQINIREKTLTEVTSSPLGAGVARASWREESSARKALLDERNYGTIRLETSTPHPWREACLVSLQSSRKICTKID